MECPEILADPCLAVGGGDQVSALKYAISAFKRGTQALLGGSKAPVCHLNISAFCEQGSNLMKHWKEWILPGRLKVRRELMRWVPPGIRESLEVIDKDVLTGNPKLREELRTGIVKCRVIYWHLMQIEEPL
ncbi:hypothetical protein DUI87_08558 [Hirundo rustica rustica]|uniref:Uncharacterized protein n=1 Tax=Hirundo rustica rustica TaxID=333673 RepID=A0A3M0KKA7_HIRRU|nr:hypothetical protein DUI87_08558 [Hirundo rustica rustica]